VERFIDILLHGLVQPSPSEPDAACRPRRPPDSLLKIFTPPAIFLFLRVSAPSVMKLLFLNTKNN